MGFFHRIKRIVSNSIQGNDDKAKDTINDAETDFETLSSLSSAFIRLEDKLGLRSTGKCAVCVKDVDTNSFNEMKEYIDNFIKIATDKKDIGFDMSSSTVVDDFGYRWFILDGKATEDIVATLNGIGQTVHEKGFSNQLLAAVFEFSSGYEGDRQNEKTGSNRISAKQYLIYNFKIDRFYPFIPILTGDGKKLRNNDQELKIMNELVEELPMEKDQSLWYPIWNIPLK